MPESPWGTWQRLWVDDIAELRVLEIQKGGYSSPHCHRTKRNVFCVAKGRLNLRLWVGEEKVMVLPCGPKSQPQVVASEVMHQFEALEDSVVYELSIADAGIGMDPDEIERHGESGKKPWWGEF